MRLFVTACTFALLINVTGCGVSAEDRMKKDVDLMNDLADAIEKKDEARATSLVQELKENGDKLKEMKVSEDEYKKLKEKYKDDGTKAFNRLIAAIAKDREFVKKINYTPRDGFKTP